MAQTFEDESEVRELSEAPVEACQTGSVPPSHTSDRTIMLCTQVDINPTYDGTDNNPVTLDEQQQEVKGRPAVRVRPRAAPSLPCRSRGVAPASADSAVLSQKEFIADPNAKGVVQRSKESLGASKVEAEKMKVEAQRTRKELKDLGALPWIVHPDAPWLKLWDFVQALTITYLFVGALLPARIFILALRLGY